MAATGILLLTFGSAVTAEDVPAHLRSVRGGVEPSPELVAEFQRRFRRIGRSPLVDITQAQAGALQGRLDERHGEGTFTVLVGMQHSSPWIAESADALAAAGCRKVLAIVLAPQYSPLILAGYERLISEAGRRHPDVEFRIAGAWHTVSGWIDSLSQRLAEALDGFPAGDAEAVPIVFTAHSLPRVVVDRDPGYIDQLNQTIDAVVAELGLGAQRWRFAWQSAGHAPAEWLKPDLLDVLPELAAAGHRAVVVAPIQFLADHLEVLYDIDVAAAEQAAQAGITMHRIAMPNSSPALVRGLAEVVDRELGAGAELGDLSGNPDPKFPIGNGTVKTQ